jgi:hypothetical protein
MRYFCLMLLLLWSAATAAPASARPPTLQVSPGYDARLAESRKAWADYQRQLERQAAQPVKRRAKARR